MDAADRERLRRSTGTLEAWVELAEEVVELRERVNSDADRAARRLTDSAVEFPVGGQPAWTVLPLGPHDETALGALARRRRLPPIAPREVELLGRLRADAPRLLRAARVLTGWRRFVTGPAARRAAEASAADLERLMLDVRGSRLLERLPDLRSDGGTPAVALADALDPAVGLSAVLEPFSTQARLLPVSVLRGAPGAVPAMLAALHTELEFRDAARGASEDIRLAEARAVLREMPVDRLRDATKGRISVGALRQAGVATVLDVFDRADELEQIPFVGAMTANRVRAAADTLWRATYDSTPVHIDAVARTAATTALISRLALWGAARSTEDPAAELERADAVNRILQAVEREDTHLAVFAAGPRGAEGFGDELAELAARARSARVPAAPQVSPDPWADFLARPAHYYALLSELGFLSEHGGKFSGDLPEDVVEAVRAFELNTMYLEASLRGYQRFAAEFALVQQRVIIGDEMGLGKTVEALAVLAHLRAQGHTHFLVISPAAVVTNWIREVADKTQLAGHRLHGEGRLAALEAWRRDGGVAVTSFGTLAWVQRHDPPSTELGCVVVDEAHYIKNPGAKRSRRTGQVLRAAPYALLLTGTPLANRLDEFTALVGHVRPDLLADAGATPTPHEFRRLVAPVYLRRNQEDVLTELPELVEVDEWLAMSSADAAAYRVAVESGNFMAMRQAACTQGSASAKLRRLVEIVGEAEDNGRRVVVFSHFRAVLEQAAAMLPGPVFGPLTGSVPAGERQLVIDRFAAAPHGAALVSQILAGGVGLNIQAASVVVICEPQLTPATEWQAIARAHRMGQLQSVQVHRLLSEDGLDQRITAMLAGKRELFDDFARESHLAHAAPEAFDVSEAHLARAVVAAERERLLGAALPDMGVGPAQAQNGGFVNRE